MHYDPSKCQELLTHLTQCHTPENLKFQQHHYGDLRSCINVDLSNVVSVTCDQGKYGQVMFANQE
jgi:hypothetical protein